MALQWWRGAVENSSGKAGWVEEERKGLKEYVKSFILKKFSVKNAMAVPFCG